MSEEVMVYLDIRRGAVYLNVRRSCIS